MGYGKRAISSVYFFSVYLLSETGFHVVQSSLKLSV